ncbi:MAG: hypothetical protein ACKORJ_06075 [Bacteroidota bacterium]
MEAIAVGFFEKPKVVKERGRFNYERALGKVTEPRRKKKSKDSCHRDSPKNDQKPLSGIDLL